MAYEKYVRSMICPKCGSILITTDYIKDQEVLVRKCSECGWSVNQLPLDSKGE